MRVCILLLTLQVLLVGAAADAQTKYWDVDIISRAGAGSATPSGAWTVNSNTWNTDSTGVGLPSIWTAGSTAVFAAGSNATGAYSVTVSGTQSLAALTVEEGAVTQNGGILDFGNNFGASIDIANGASWAQANSGRIIGAGGIEKNGAGTLALRGNNTFSNTGTGDQPFLTISAGVVDFVADANLGAVPTAADNGSALTIDGGTLRYSGTSTIALDAKRGVLIGSGGATFEVTSNTVTLALGAGASATNALTGSGTITKTGAGRFRLQTAQTTFTGKYVVKGGSLVFPSEDRLGAVPTTTQADYFTLDGGGLYGDLSSGGTLNAKRGITLGASGGYLAFSGTGLSYDGIIAGTQGGALSLTTVDAMGSASSGTISLNSVNTYNGPTLIASGMTVNVAQLANGGVNSAIGSSSNAAGNLVLDGGTLHYTGAAVSTDRNFTMTASGATIDASGAENATLTFTNAGTVVMSGTGPRVLTLRGTSTGDNVFSQAITDSGGATTVNKLDAGTWVLKNTTSNYTGDTIIGAGLLKLGASGVLPDTSGIQVFTSSVFDMNGFNETVRSISGTAGTIAMGNKTLTLSNPNNETYTGTITGAGGGRIVKNGTGKLTLSPSSAAYDGGVVLNAGTLVLGTHTALGTGTLTINNSPTLAATSSTTVFPLNNVTLAGDLTFDSTLTGATGSIIWGANGNKWTISGGDRTITVNSAAGGFGARIDQPIGQDLEGLSLIKKGNGTLTLNGANAYTGNTIIWAGTVSVSQPYMADWAGVFLTSAAKLNLNFAAGVSDTVNTLFIDGSAQAIGTWGAIGSGADHESALFTGAGLLNVVPWGQPPTAVPLPGDFNNDGTVDSGDYLTWRKANGTNTVLLNDNGLGVPVGQQHFDLWRQNFGNTRAAGNGLAGGAVPEPAAGLLFVFGVAASALVRVRRAPALK